MNNGESSQTKRRLGDAGEVATILDCSERSVYRLADEGKIPFGLKLGAMRRWDLDALEKWIDDGCKPVR